MPYYRRVLVSSVAVVGFVLQFWFFKVTAEESKCNDESCLGTPVIRTVDMGGGDGWSLPFFDHPNHTQYLYLASEIRASGRLVRLTFVADKEQYAPVFCDEILLRVSHLSSSVLKNKFSENYHSERSNLVFNKPISITPQIEHYKVTISLEQPFEYNGVDNLVLDFQVPVGCSNRLYLVSSPIPNRSLNQWPNPTGFDIGELSAALPTVTFTFND